MLNQILYYLGGGYIPHGYCLAWSPYLLWTLVFSHLLIGLSYYSIPFCLIMFIKKQKNISFDRVFTMFSSFIFACGTTHFLSIVDIWIPLYKLDAILLLGTAIISVITAIFLFPITKQALYFIDQNFLTLDKLDKSEKKFKTIFANAPNGLALVDLNGNFLVVNQALCKIFNYSENELLNINFQSLTHPDDLEKDLSEMQLLLNGLKDSYTIEKRYYTKEKRIVFSQLDVSLLKDKNSNPLFFISQIHDITERKNYEESLHEAKELAQVTLSSIGDGVICTDKTGQITFINEIAGQILGVTSSECINKSFNQCITLLEKDVVLNNCIEQTLSFEKHKIFNVLLKTKTGTAPMNITMSQIKSLSGDVIGVICVLQDISVNIAMQDKLFYQARHDLLTTLPNRLDFEETLSKVKTEKHKINKNYLLYLDLDHFKVINDNCGHNIGDKLLKEISSLIYNNLRTSDYFSRIGGDEFAIILKEFSVEKTLTLCERIIQSVKGYRLTFEEKSYQVGVSIGVSEINSQEDTSIIMAHADTACYAAKKLGRGTVKFYTVNDHEITEAKKTFNFAQKIQSAINSDNFIIYLQKIIGREQQILGYETLIRLKDENNEILSPSSFLPVAKRMEWMPKIDQWVVKKIFEMINSSRFKKTEDEKIYFSINLSAQSISDQNFVTWLLALIDEHKPKPSLLRFEVTETEKIHPNGIANSCLDSLQKYGFKIWLDDFGMGYNSFELLKKLPVDGLKIDYTFINSICNDTIDKAFVEAIVSIGKQMKLKLIAEGVENQDTFDLLYTMGVQAFQGHYFHKAQPEEQIFI